MGGLAAGARPLAMGGLAAGATTGPLAFLKELEIRVHLIARCTEPVTIGHCTARTQASPSTAATSCLFVCHINSHRNGGSCVSRRWSSATQTWRGRARCGRAHFAAVRRVWRMEERMARAVPGTGHPSIPPSRRYCRDGEMEVRSQTATCGPAQSTPGLQMGCIQAIHPSLDYTG